jgi:hypothetical protein
MPEEAFNGKKKYKVIIYHGHLHKIPLDETEEEYPDHIKVVSEDSIKQDTS